MSLAIDVFLEPNWTAVFLRGYARFVTTVACDSKSRQWRGMAHPLQKAKAQRVGHPQALKAAPPVLYSVVGEKYFRTLVPWTY